MLPQIKHYRVNWEDGMKIARTHFLQLEDALDDQIRDMAGIYLNDFNYGLLPAVTHTRQSLDVQLFFDRSEQVTVKVMECRAITPGGARIEILPNFQAVEAVVNRENLKAPAYEIYLVVNPFVRLPFGQPDPEETPLRQPFTLPQYRLEILPYPQTHQPEYSAYQLCVGRLLVEGDFLKLSEHYIPPCASLISHPRLVAIHQKLLSQLGEAEIAVTGIMQRIKAKQAMAQLDQSLLYLAEKIAGFIAHSLDTFRLLLLQQPPVQVITYFARFSRIMHVSLNSLIRIHREELLDYFHKWFELPPREMENLLRTLLTISYDHTDAYDALNKVELFTSRILVLLKKMNELNYVGQPQEQKEKHYGWLVLHTEGRKPSIYKIKEKSVIIGRQEGNFEDVDFDIQEDHWVSRRHAKLTVKEENGYTSYLLCDLKSNNGTYVHDTKTRLKPNEEFQLNDGDTIQVGKTNMVFKSSTTTTENDLMQEMDRYPYYKLSNITDLVVG
jgi:hypothetical protein